MSKRVMMITSSNKSDIFELLQTIWTQPSHEIMNKMLTENRDEASMTANYHRMVATHIRKEISKNKSKACEVVGMYGNNKMSSYIKAEFVKEHYDVLAKHISLIEEIGDVYSINKTDAEAFVEDHILPNMCSDELMAVTAICDRFIIVNKETGAGYHRHSMLILVNESVEFRLSQLHRSIKAMNKFKPFSKSEIVYSIYNDDNDISPLYMYKCDTEKEIKFTDMNEFTEIFGESMIDLQKLIKRSVCYFNEKVKTV